MIIRNFSCLIAAVIKTHSSLCILISGQLNRYQYRRHVLKSVYRLYRRSTIKGDTPISHNRDRC